MVDELYITALEAIAADAKQRVNDDLLKHSEYVTVNVTHTHTHIRARARASTQTHARMHVRNRLRVQHARTNTDRLTEKEGGGGGRYDWQLNFLKQIIKLCPWAERNSVVLS